ncbi:hypothetical protein [Thalassovita mediterranea]|uniref:Uncharacterized protein n=1 Tax=Thalassovita mediterranea TaxID=340021 RepID=A0A0P1H508_9RHOB|nr:hypothetical protein [Thalassovita mediterranea]CUH84372.1 hypothetical protein TM5383_01581 [Thalassovita mediterranea]SIS31945.1 hypothetical protein SAMN05421685_105177 [Thalassovita mediterranea]
MRVIIGLGVLTTILLAGIFWYKHTQQSPLTLDDPRIAARYATPLTRPEQAMAVYHLGHSLVGRDMPAMLQQLTTAQFGLAPNHHSQLGWGTSLQAHWGPDEDITGFAEENAHPHYRSAKPALATGDYDAVILTEMVEIRDAIAYFDSPQYLQQWAETAWNGNPQARVYFYETWHEITDPEGWLTRLDRDLERYWTGQILFPALQAMPQDRSIHVIPAGQVLAAFSRTLQTLEQPENHTVTEAEDLFRRDESGVLDPIHINDLGAYLVALTHFATLYHTSPVGLPHDLLRADGTPIQVISPQTARLMQEITWEVVKTQPLTGVSAR